MSDDALARSVERLANLLINFPDTSLDRPWSWKDYDSEGIRFAFFRTYEELVELAVKLRQERLARGHPQSQAQEILSYYHAAFNDLQASVSGLSADLVDRAPGENDWPVRRVLSHIVGGDLGFFVAVKYALDGHRLEDGRPEEIPDETWDAITGMDEAAYKVLMRGPFENLQVYHRGLHQRVLREFETIQDVELEGSCKFWEKEPMSLRFRLHRFDSHMRQHTIQIDKTIDRLNGPQPETKRLLRLIYSALAGVEGVLIGAPGVGEEERNRLAKILEARLDEISGALA